SPGADRMMPAATALRLALATAHRVVDRVHRHAAHMRAPALPACAPGFHAENVHMIDIPILSDCCETVLVNPANLARGHFHQRVAAFEVVEYGLLSGAAGDLAAPSRHQFDVVNACA